MLPSKYVVERELSSGGMGRVFLGRLNGQADFFRPIVIKRLLDADDLDMVALFVEEARRYAVLDHENIGRIFDFERVDGELSIILEYIDGWSLIDFLERHRATGEAPNAELCVFIVSRVCRALQYVYESAGIVHRDVSPSNIMMTREGAVKLIDFGIAARSGKRESRLSGKPAYMAPEMVVELRADNRSDLFGLGAVLYEMLTLERLFKGATTSDVLGQVVAGQVPSPREIRPEIPEGVVEILRKALQRDPEQRYHSAAEMGQACEHFLYDKGYGPTNLTLKKHLLALWPDSAAGRQPPASESFPVIEPTLIPIGDGSDRVAHLGADDATRAALPLDVRPASLPPGPGTLAPRRIKKRQR
jgi:serine/threonine protein kinase